MRDGLHRGDARAWAGTLPAQSIQTIVTSPPYYGLRSYLPADHPDKGRELGGEATVGEYVANLVALFAALRPALRDDGTLWINLGDSYANDAKWGGATGGKHVGGLHGATGIGREKRATGFPPKSLIGVPWRVAFALQDDGWVLRSDIVWHKPNPMPESVTDRPTRAHEYLFLFSKRPRYFYDAAAIAEPISQASIDRISQPNFANQTGGEKDYANGTNPARSMRKTLENFAKKQDGHGRRHAGFNERYDFDNPAPTRNKRDVWSIPTQPYPGSHYAVMPAELVRPCILAGTSARGACAACGAPWRRVVERTEVVAASHKGSAFDRGKTGVNGLGRVQDGERYEARPTGDWEPSCACGVAETVPCLVADPFLGSGTVAAVAIEEGRRWAGCDLDERNAALVAGRIDGRQVRLGVTA